MNRGLMNACGAGSGRCGQYSAASAAGCLADQLGALDYLFVASPEFAARYFPDGVSRSALLKAPAVAFDYLDDMHMAFLQTNFDLALAVCRATYSIPQKPLCSWQNRAQPVV